MLLIDQLPCTADPTLAPLLLRYEDLLDLATIIVVEPGDTLADVISRLGHAFDGWEFIHAHPIGWHEAVFITSDDGAGVVVFVPDRQGVDPALLELCRASATSPA